MEDNTRIPFPGLNAQATATVQPDDGIKTQEGDDDVKSNRSVTDDKHAGEEHRGNQRQSSESGDEDELQAWLLDVMRSRRSSDSRWTKLLSSAMKANTKRENARDYLRNLQWRWDAMIAEASSVTYIHKLEQQIKQLQKTTASRGERKRKRKRKSRDRNRAEVIKSPNAGYDTDASKSIPSPQTSLEDVSMTSQLSGASSSPSLKDSRSQWKLEVLRRTARETYPDAGVGESESDSDTPENDASETRSMSGNILRVRRYLFKNRSQAISRLYIRSKPLVDAVAEIVTLSRFEIEDDVKVYYFDEPYWELFHNRQKLTEHCRRLQGEAKEHLQFLLDFLRKEAADVSKVQDEIDSGAITEIHTDYAYLLYPPNEIVLTRIGSQWEGYRVKRLEGIKLGDERYYRPSPLTIHLLYLRFQGRNSKPTFETSPASPFVRIKESVKIEALTFIPSRLYPGASEIFKDLRERGREYWKYGKGPVLKEYKGDAWPINDRTDALRVMVDISGEDGNFYSDERDGSATPHPLEKFKSDPDVPFEDQYDQSIGHATDLLPNATAGAREPSDEELLLFPLQVRAFSLRNRNWRSVNIIDLYEPKFETGVFDKLVIKDDLKQLVTSTVNAYSDNRVFFKDMIKGKGNGLVILMHGPPGVGKTLTAECIAETQKRPLYMLTSGDLGVDAEMLEERLREAFALATRWKAVLLLDEADVFLQERDVRQLERNALVSVFLREVEYFNGILFLTTNRPGWLDEAFQSRIHLTLHLPGLEPRDQLRVWSIFLYGNREVQSLTHEQQAFLADVLSMTLSDGSDGSGGKRRRGGLNGREIRNHVMMARALAAERESHKVSIHNTSHSSNSTTVAAASTHDHKINISLEDIKMVISAAKNFTEYMRALQRGGPEERALQNHWRGPS